MQPAGGTAGAVGGVVADHPVVAGAGLEDLVADGHVGRGEVIDGVQADRLAGLTDSIFVDRDGYIVDGHHRWAGAMGADVEFEGDAALEMDTLNTGEDILV